MEPTPEEAEPDALQYSSPLAEPPVGEPPEIQFLGGVEFQRDVQCWRCHSSYPEHLLECPQCGATNRQKRDIGIEFAAERDYKVRPIMIVLVTYGIILLGSFLMAMYLRFNPDPLVNDPSKVNGPILFLEIVDTLVVLIALVLSGLVTARINPVPKVSTAIAAWLAFSVGLGMMILLNQFYHRMLMEMLGMQEAEEVYSGTWPTLLILFCLQPAIVEELFARQLCLAVFQKVMGLHMSVFITALMFALMHIFVYLSVPYLFMLGVFLGYARVLGGTIFLPMALHFAHNLIVIILEKA